MNQTPTSNQGGDDDRGPSGEGAPSFARDTQGETGNPYYGARRVQEDPDLDADAPVLRSSDVQRLNRKALLFLAGIVALLVVMTFWLLNQTDQRKVLTDLKKRVFTEPKKPAKG